MTRRVAVFLLRNAPAVLLVVVLLAFGIGQPAFLRPASLAEIVTQSASVGIVATGMTIVLLTGGIDLSVGSIMFVGAAVAGKMVLADKPFPLPAALAAVVLVGLAFGAANAALISGLRILPFVVTLATLFVGRGFGLWVTETRAMNLPDGFLRIGHARLLGVPMPVVVLAVVVAAAHVLLAHTPFGRQLYAVGIDAEAARKAGINTRRTVAAAYVLSGLCAAVGAIVSLAQLGSVSPSFGNQREFDAIAAAVLGGTSLFGGRGGVFPGTVMGAVLIQAVYGGLVAVNADPYLYPIITSSIIFVAVLIDRVRHAAIRRLLRLSSGIEPR